MMMAIPRALSKTFRNPKLLSFFSQHQCFVLRYGPLYLNIIGFNEHQCLAGRCGLVNHTSYWSISHTGLLKKLNREVPHDEANFERRGAENFRTCQRKENARKMLLLSHMYVLTKELHRVHDEFISYKHLMQICMEFVGLYSEEDAKEIVRLLDESGRILLVGNRAYLHPEQLTRAIESVMMPLYMAPKYDVISEELERMEKKKMEIDLKAKKMVRSELWCGLGLLSLQTVAFARLTFWELSWDVMEPICFYATSIYFLGGYVFFLKTTTDPTFEGYFKARFQSKQKLLMKRHNFDAERFKELEMMS